jgi:hypothetical protein
MENLSFSLTISPNLEFWVGIDGTVLFVRVAKPPQAQALQSFVVLCVTPTPSFSPPPPPHSLSPSPPNSLAKWLTESVPVSVVRGLHAPGSGVCVLTRYGYPQFNN